MAGSQPERFVEALRRFRHDQAGKEILASAHTKAEWIAALIEKAIRESWGGFEQNSEVSVGSGAEGLGVSRTVFQEAVRDLVEKGFLLPRANKPYKVLGRSPAYPVGDSEISGASLSLTDYLEKSGRTDTGSWVGDVRAPSRDEAEWIPKALEKGARVKALLGPDARLDPSTTWRLLSRVRYKEASGRYSIWLAEAVVLGLNDSICDALEKEIDASREERQFSLSRALEIAGVVGLHRSRRHIMIDTLGASPGGKLVGQAQNDALRHVSGRRCDLLGDGPLQRWDYGFFGTDPLGLVACSFAFWDPNRIEMFM